MAKKKKRKEENVEPKGYVVELKGILIVLIAIIGLCPFGIVAEFIKGFSCFLFGALWALFLVFLGGIGIYTIIKRKSPKILNGKTIGIFVILIGVLTLLHMSYIDTKNMDPNKFDILKDNSEFTDEMYDLYEQVFNHSTYSLEKLNKEFFENDISKVITLSVNDKVEAIVQIIEDRINDTLIFEFGGYNYELAHEYDLYHNMLIEIVKYGIRNKFKYINLGQTAYDAKLKFGAEIKQSYFLLSHSNKFLNFLIKKYIKFLEYKVEEYNFNVFRNGDEK
jgi:hypothetical protein